MSAGRILLLVAGTIAGLAAAALIAAGTTASLGRPLEDGQGRVLLEHGRQAVSTQTHAFVSDPIEIDEGADWIFDDQGNLTFRIATAGTDGRPVFVGVAPKDAVAVPDRRQLRAGHRHRRRPVPPEHDAAQRHRLAGRAGPRGHLGAERVGHRDADARVEAEAG